MTLGRMPARAVLDEIERHIGGAGHEHRGFLSLEYGFLPRSPLPLALPASHAAWDELAEALPRLWRDAAVRQAVEGLPLLRATPEALPDDALRRAATILGMVAHSYVRSELTPAGPVPAAIAQPWADVASRLHRPEPYLAFEDIDLGNWRLVDPEGPRLLPNLRMLVPSWRIPAEERFHLGMIEMHERAKPLVAAAVAAQQAIADHDTEALDRALGESIAVVGAVHEHSFLGIDPNAHADGYVDPALWGILVAQFAVSLEAHIPAPGGTASPIFHVLDGMLGRVDFHSEFGKEAQRLRTYGPPAVSAFIAAVAEMPVGPAVRASGSRRLQGVLQTLVDVYAGPRGLLAAHRMKAYGYLEVAFKVGRPVTLGGIGGTFHQRPWQTVDGELDLSRLERAPEDFRHPRRVTLLGREPVDDSADGRVKRIVLDVADRGLLYRPGDRCGILPEAEPALVERTLTALRASGEELVPLTRTWREALRRRPGLAGASELPLRDLLRFARLRPLPREIAKTLQRLADSARLAAVVEARREDQWELWDALELVAADGYDVTRLWRAEMWQEECLAAILPPEPFRLYSISSAPGDPARPQRLELTAGALRYTTEGGPQPPVTRRGLASTHLNETASTQPDDLVVDVVHPLRFQLPHDPATPLVMIAGGTGISPFRGFLQARAVEPAAGPAWLLLSARRLAELPYRSELEEAVAGGRLRLDVAFSREDVVLERQVSGDEHLRFRHGPARRIDELIASPEVADDLWAMLDGAAERPAVFYLCGQGPFAQTVMSALGRLAAERLGDAEAGAPLLRRMVGQRRLMLDVFTTFVPAMGAGALGSGQFDASEVALHNDDEHGYWMVIDGNVYDVTEFRHLHPGGSNIVVASAGMDATSEYRIVNHHQNAEIDAMLSMYKIGTIRRLDFGGAWGIRLTAEGFEYVSLGDAFRAWVRLLYLVVEMENALATDVLYLGKPMTDAEDGDELTPLKLMMFGNTHRRFVQLYFHGILGEDLEDLWSLTAGMCAQQESPMWARDALERLRSSPAAQAMRDVEEHLLGLYRHADPRSAEEWGRASAIVSAVLDRDRRFIHDVKHLLREGVRQFESHQDKTLEVAGPLLVAVLRGIVETAEAFQRDLPAALSEPGAGP